MTRSPSVEDLVLGHVLDDRRRGRVVATAHRPVSARARNARPGRFCETLVGPVAGSRSSNASPAAAPHPQG